MDRLQYCYAIVYENNRETVFRFETHIARDLFMSKQKDKSIDAKPVTSNSDIVKIAYAVFESRNLDWTDGIVVCAGERRLSDGN